MDLQISDWRLVQLTVEDVGPFRNGPETFSFAGEPTQGDPDPGPSNLYMVLARNGFGKTTLIESIHGLFGLMSDPPSGCFARTGATGRAQADFRATWTIDGKTQSLIVSIWTGATEPLVVWTEEALAQSQASYWATLGLVFEGVVAAPLPASDERGRLLYQNILTQRGLPPTDLFGLSQEMPTILYFPADRKLVRPQDTRRVERPESFGYQPAQSFSTDGPDWPSTMDNLLVWLDWLNDGRLEELLTFVNDRVFRADQGKVIRSPRRAELLTYVSTATGDHPLIGLSHGERALLQLYVRIACHMTRNTIVLIDEVDTHLHSRWMISLYTAIKSLLRDRPSLSVVFSTHNRELIELFDHTTKEEGLVKGGYLIEEEIS